MLPSMSALHGLGRVGSGGAYRGPLDAGADADDAIPARPQHPLTNPLPHSAPTNQFRSAGTGRGHNEMQCAREERAGSRRGGGKEAGEPYRSRRGGMREAAAGGGAEGVEAIGVFVTEPFSLSGAAGIE